MIERTYNKSRQKVEHEYGRGIDFYTGRFFTFCQLCGRRWNDGGKRWKRSRKEKEVG